MKVMSAAVAFLLLAAAGSAEGAVKTKKVDYKQGDTPLQGTFAWDDAVKGKRPGILIIHEWWGHNEHARKQAERFAKEGYAAFALDMYGKGKVAKHPDDAKKFMAEATKDPQVVMARFSAALEQLKKQPQVDPEKVAAAGYCFGGGVALNMARSGADLDAVVTFHGALDAAMQAQKGQVKPRILVLTGADDPMIPPAKVEAFKQEMAEAGAQVEVVSYPGAKHSFTNPDADKAGMPALAYNAEADKQSFAAATALLKQVFGTQSSAR
jgi:dienelactone hydrolase